VEGEIPGEGVGGLATRRRHVDGQVLLERKLFRGCIQRENAISKRGDARCPKGRKVGQNGLKERVEGGCPVKERTERRRNQKSRLGQAKQGAKSHKNAKERVAAWQAGEGGRSRECGKWDGWEHKVERVGRREVVVEVVSSQPEVRPSQSAKLDGAEGK
jgi:hypothetical protein